MARQLVALIVAAISVGCATLPTAPGGPIDQQVTLAPGQSAIVDGTSARILFHSVMGDSRCPANALCIWAGDAVVRIAVIESASQRTYDLHTNAYQPVEQGNLVRHGDRPSPWCTSLRIRLRRSRFRPTSTASPSKSPAERPCMSGSRTLCVPQQTIADSVLCRNGTNGGGRGPGESS
jgi:hypothetical protein